MMIMTNNALPYNQKWHVKLSVTNKKRELQINKQTNKQKITNIHVKKKKKNVESP
jgi:hypothetical protein